MKLSLPLPAIALTLFIVSFSLLPFPLQAIGQVMGFESRFTAEGPITMEADKVTYDQKEGSISLEGSVRIVQKDISIQADKVIYYETKDVVAEGSVVLIEGEDILRCKRLELNIETKKGVVYEGKLFLKKKNFHITGGKAEKLGESAYRVYDATLTSCDARVPPWEFTAKRLDVDVEGYAEGLWPGFRVLDIPILYFPWATFPVKKERQSGFLFPDFSYSSRWGPDVTIPFYWAIAPNQDATFYAERIGDARGRGFKEGAEYRYAWSTHARGQIKGFYIWDDRFDKSLWWKERDDKSRWAVFFDHDQSIPNGYYLKANVNWVSDANYPTDFSSDIPVETRIDASSSKQLESTITAGKNWGWGALETDAYYFRDLTLANNSATMQMLPQTTFSLYQDRLLDTPLFYEIEAQGTNFWRQGLSPSPRYGEVRRGGRVDFYPSLSVPLKLDDVVRFEPWIGYRETAYFPVDDPGGLYNKVTSRELYDAGASLATTLSRVYPLGWGRVQKLKHIIEPEVIYNYIPEVDQTDNPVFDHTDRIFRKNSVTWVLTNYLIGKVVNDKGEVSYPEYLYLKLYQSYNFFPDLSALSPADRQHLSNLAAEARFAPFSWLSGAMNLEYNPQHRRLDIFNTGIHFRDTRGDHLAVDYRRTRHQVEPISGEKTSVEEVNTELGIHIIEPLDFYFAYRYNLFDKLRIETVYGLDFRQQCWEVSLRLHDIGRQSEVVNGVLTAQRREVKVMVYITLTGLGQYHF
jgi:LPS-assembly protein